MNVEVVTDKGLTMTRDDVLAGRIGLALSDAKALYDALSILATKPPATGTEQEDMMGNAEVAIRNAIYFVKRLQGWAK